MGEPISVTFETAIELAAAFARQQTAAKDAELADANQRVDFQRTQILDLDAAVERQTALKKSAERERDSLRVENANMRRAGDSLQEEFMTFVQHTPAYETERDAAPFFTSCTNPDCEEGSVENGRCQSCDGTGWNRIPFEQVANDLYLASRRGFDAFKVELLAALNTGKDGQ